MSKLIELIKALFPASKRNMRLMKPFYPNHRMHATFSAVCDLMDRDARDSARGLVFGNQMP